MTNNKRPMGLDEQQARDFGRLIMKDRGTFTQEDIDSDDVAQFIGETHASIVQSSFDAAFARHDDMIKRLFGVSE